jgi:hypothetical protein
MNWISVKERLPEAGEVVLIVEAKFGRRYPRVLIGWIDDQTNDWTYEEEGQLWRESASSDHYYITHWMALPEPPEEFKNTRD